MPNFTITGMYHVVEVTFGCQYQTWYWQFFLVLVILHNAHLLSELLWYSGYEFLMILHLTYGSLIDPSNAEYLSLFLTIATKVP